MNIKDFLHLLQERGHLAVQDLQTIRVHAQPLYLFCIIIKYNLHFNIINEYECGHFHFKRKHAWLNDARTRYMCIVLSKTAHIYVAEAFKFPKYSLKITFSQFSKTAIFLGQKGVLLNLLLYTDLVYLLLTVILFITLSIISPTFICIHCILLLLSYF